MYVFIFNEYSYRTAPEILILMAYAQLLTLNTHADVSSRAQGLIGGLSLFLHPYFLHAQGSQGLKSI